MANFSSNEAVSLEKVISGDTNSSQINQEDLNYVYELDKCVQWIKDNNFKKVCLQFPDHLLRDSADVALIMQDALNQVIYILGDSAYESCCVDYVGAAHVNADAVIHYGPVCSSKTSDEIPCLFVYEKWALNVCDLVSKAGQFEGDLVVDTPYVVHIPEIMQMFSRSKVYPVTQEGLHLTDVIFVGSSVRKVTNFFLSQRPSHLAYYDPKRCEIEKFEPNGREMKRRRFLHEKIKDSKTIGIVIGTLAVRNYLDVMERIKTLITLHNKKYYVISVGKPTVAKLANFMEIDLFVIISCAMSEIYESREFYQPIVAPYDIEAALNSDIEFTYDFGKLNEELTQEERDAITAKLLINDSSLLTGKIRCNETVDEHEVDGRIALKQDGTISVNSPGDFLRGMSWKGLEQRLGCDEPQIATEGRQGLAQSYANEGS